MHMHACSLLGIIHGNATIIENCIATVTVLLNNYGGHKKKSPVPETEEQKRAKIDKRNEGDR